VDIAATTYSITQTIRTHFIGHVSVVDTHTLIQRMMETTACRQPEPLYIIAVRTTSTLSGM